MEKNTFLNRSFKLV